jgi:hypothetical protein
MRIGLVVDGDSEFAALPNLNGSLVAVTGNTFLNPVKASIQPYAPLPAIAQVCLSGVSQLEKRRVDRVIVLLDREQRAECCPQLAAGLEGLLAKSVAVPTRVVLKNRTFENWVVADVQALVSQPARFDVSNGLKNSVLPNKADNVNALPLLKAACKGSYHKIQDSKRTLDKADPLRLAGNSRSFRRFLHLVGHPEYAAQSRLPG